MYANEYFLMPINISEPAQTDKAPSTALLTEMKNIKADPPKIAGGGPGRVQGGPEGVTESRRYPQDQDYPQGGGYPQGGLQDEVYADLMQRIMNAERRIQDCCESINSNEGAIRDKVNSTLTICRYIVFNERASFRKMNE